VFVFGTHAKLSLPQKYELNPLQMNEELSVSEKLSSVGFGDGIRRRFSSVSDLISSTNEEE